jgi:hypothetical protein
MGIEVETVPASWFYAYASNNIEIWRSIIGQRVTHFAFNNGTVFDITQNEDHDIYVWVRFDNAVESVALGLTNTLQFPTKALIDKFTHVVLPVDLSTNVKAIEQRKKEMEEEKLRGSMEHIRQFGITYLYHMTSITNLDSILRHTLLSHNEAHRRGLVSVDISDPDVQDRRSRKSIDNLPLHDYVCLYFSPRNPMLYRRKDQQLEIILLGIDPCVLLDEHTIFSDGNAASGPTHFYKGISQLAQLPWDVINAQYWTDFEDGKRMKCAEVLVYLQMDVQHIRKIFCYALEQCAFCQKLTSGKIPVEVNTSFYF